MFADNGFAVAPYSSIAGITFYAMVAESAVPSDQVETQVVYGRLVSEVAASQDTVFTKTNTFVSVSESSIVSDVVFSLVNINSSITENITSSEAINTQLDGYVYVLESVAVEDAAASVLILDVTVTETVVVDDAILARYLWEPVQSYSPTVWSNIGTIN